MDELIELIKSVLPAIIIFGKMVFDNSKKRVKEIEREKLEIEKQRKRDEIQDSRELENKTQIQKIGESVSSMKTSIDLRGFERRFLRKFKNDNKKFISNLDISNDLKLFCKAGVSQLSAIFKTILDAKFDITAEEIQDELSESKVFLSSQFKTKNEEYKKYVPIVKNEMMQFLLYLEDVKVLENGHRMSEFEKLCKRTSISIITNVAKLN